MTNWESSFAVNTRLEATSQIFPGTNRKTVCSPKAKLIIELDGNQHLEQEEYDQKRTEYLEEQGYKVVRFWNNDVMNDIEGVILAIMHALENEPSMD